MIKRFLTLALFACGACHLPSVVATSIGAGAVQLTPVTISEFYNATLDHYFITADSAEAAALDNGVHAGWMRTGYAFTGYETSSSNPLISPVCRYYRRPEAGLDPH